MARTKVGNLKYRPWAEPPNWWKDGVVAMDVTSEQLKAIWPRPHAEYRAMKERTKHSNNWQRIYFLVNGEVWLELHTWAGPFGAPHSYQLPEVAAKRARKLQECIAEL